MKLSILANNTERAQSEAAPLWRAYGIVSPHDADVIVALGGDGYMLDVAHSHAELGLPIFGLNCGAVGFMMNSLDSADLEQRIADAVEAVIYPLQMVATTSSGHEYRARAINEVSLFRKSPQASQLRIEVDGKQRMERLICDGVLLATPAGSTAYNLSAHGPIIPLGSPLMALTPITPFRPRRWRGALLPETANVRFEVIDPDKRPVIVAADSRSFEGVVSVEVVTAVDAGLRLLFDDNHSLEERILSEQFAT